MYQIYPKSGKQLAAAICSMVSIFFSLKVAHMRIDNNFKGHYIENRPKLKGTTTLMISMFYQKELYEP